MQAVSYCYAMVPILKKLCKTEEEFREGLKRHLQFFNTQGEWGGAILGLTAAMEESRAQHGEPDGEAITSVKTGLMGPFAGIGDTMGSTLNNIFYPIAIALSAGGSVAGWFFIWSLAIVQWVIGWVLCKYSYDIGREGISKILSSGLINKVLTGAGALGLFMMGSLGASTVKLSLAFSWTVGEVTNSLQSYLDSIIPGLLPLCVIWLIFFFVKKKGDKISPIILAIVLSCLVASFFGIV